MSREDVEKRKVYGLKSVFHFVCYLRRHLNILSKAALKYKSWSPFVYMMVWKRRWWWWYILTCVCIYIEWLHVKREQKKTRKNERDLDRMMWIAKKERKKEAHFCQQNNFCPIFNTHLQWQILTQQFCRHLRCCNLKVYYLIVFHLLTPFAKFLTLKNFIKRIIINIIPIYYIYPICMLQCPFATPAWNLFEFLCLYFSHSQLP